VRTVPPSRTAASLLTAALVAVAGCGGGGGPATGPEADRSAAPTSTPVVATGDFYFRPSPIEVRVDEEITWENVGETIHNVEGKGFFSKAINPGETWEHSFERAGTYEYLCNLHPTLMTGSVVVAPK
jgi:plastocyanin